MNNQNYKLGQKIKNFRKRAGKSQMELELEIEASPGSLSRIESGEVNPTKETLLKIIDVLDLQSIEATGLLGVDINLSSLLNIPKEILNSEDLNEVLLKAVNNIVYELNLLAGFITLRKGDKLFSQVTTDRSFNKFVFSIIDVPFNKLSVGLDPNSRNLCVRSFLDKKIYFSNKLSDITVPAIPLKVANLMEKVTKFKSGIVMPIMYNNEVYGTFCVGKMFEDDFRAEIPILESFANYIGEAIHKTNLNN